MPSIFKPKEKNSKLDPVIDDLISEMAGFDGGGELYSQAATNLKVLVEAKSMETKQDRLSLDTIAVVAGNIAGIAMILLFEKNGIITSKSLSLLNRPRT